MKVNLIFGAALVAVLSICAESARADTDRLDREASFEIAAQPLSTALVQFSKQAAVQVITASDQLGERETAGVVGKRKVREALEILLQRSGLEYSLVGGNTIAIGTANRESQQTQGSGTKASFGGPELQLAQSESPQTEGSGAQKTNTESPSAEPANTIQEIVVTAQKREERLQDVPMSISVLTGNELDSSTLSGVADLLNNVPGTTLRGVGGPAPTISIRGVGAQRGGGAGSTPIAYYLDGVPFSLIRSAAVVDTTAYDLERVEVLRGPQGTLYGASALGGVVRVLTKDANLEEVEFKARASSSYLEDAEWNYRGDVAVNVPIVSGKLAARGVVGYQNESGWINRPNQSLTDANGSEIRNVRLKLNAKPTDQLSIAASAWQTRSDYDAGPGSNENFQNFGFVDEPLSSDLDVYGLRLGYEFAPFSVESQTSYLERSFTSTADLTAIFGFFFPYSTDQYSEVLTEEISFRSTHGGPWRWSAGGMYRDAKEDLGQADAFDIFTSRRVETSESFAVFGELTRLFADEKIELTAGLRYFEDKVALDEKVNSAGLPLVSARNTFDAVSPRAVITWHPSQDFTGYASYAEGFRSGSSQAPVLVRISPDFPPVSEDTLRNYEVGMKGNLMGGRLGVEAAAYYIDWQDVQNQLVVLVVNATINGGSASGPGFDFSVTARPTDAVELGTTFSWNDLTWDNDVLSGGNVLFAKGERLNTSPEYTAAAWVNYAFPLGQSGFEGRLSASANFISEQSDRTLQGGNLLIGPGDDILTARTSFSVEAQTHWVATLFVDNLTNEDGAIVLAPNQIPTQGLSGQYVRPRTIGLQLEYRY